MCWRPTGVTALAARSSHPSGELEPPRPNRHIIHFLGLAPPPESTGIVAYPLTFS